MNKTARAKNYLLYIKLLVAATSFSMIYYIYSLAEYYKSYSKEIDHGKLTEVISQGHTYYVNAEEQATVHRNGAIIIPLFVISVLMLVIYSYRIKKKMF